MSLLASIFGKKEKPAKTNQDFWNWFMQNEQAFFKAVSQRDKIERDFFDKLSPKLNQIKSGFYFLAGMHNEHTAELVLTADGTVKNIAFVEDLVSIAPQLNNWLFTALKPAMDIKNVTIEMAGFKFSGDKLFFYAEESRLYPDEISITIVHDDVNPENKNTILNGVYIFLDNFLGELNFATTVDNLTVIAKADAEKDLIPIEKLKAYLIWREKEFIEKYEGLRHNTGNDEYSSFEATLKNGMPLIAIINMALLSWDRKASHPWIMEVEIKYDGKNNNGLPDDKTYKLLGLIEDDICAELKDFDGYLNIGRQTANNTREIYFACNDFRKPSKVAHAIQQKYSGQLTMGYEIYKDKYWKSFNRFEG